MDRRTLLILALLAPGAAHANPTEKPRRCDSEPDVEHLPVRRLTRAQYRQVTAELLGLEASVADRALPADERLGGFVSNTRSLLTEAHVEQYVEAGEDLATRAVQNLPRLLGCSPAQADCPRTFVQRFGARAFRRPLGDDETASFLKLLGTGAAKGAFPDGVRLVVQTMLASPHFLYRLEAGQEAREVAPLSSHALAHRMALFLWDGLPDADLLEADAPS